MKKRLVRISVMRAELVLVAFYGVVAVILVPVFLVLGAIGLKTGGVDLAATGIGFAVLMPLIYAAFGFVGGVIFAALYNLVAKLTGGFEFELVDLA